MAVSREQLLNLLQKTLTHGDGLIGGRRHHRSASMPRHHRSASMPRHRTLSRSRRTRGRGEGDMMTMDDMEIMLPSESRYGNGLIGGRKKKSGTKKSKPMSEKTKRYLKSYHKKHPRKSRGRGLIGGSAQEYFDDLVDEYLMDHPGASIATAESYAQAELGQNKDLLKLGVTPRKTKDQLIRAIRSLERRIGIPESITTHLRTMTKDRLMKLYASLSRDKDVFRRPTYAEEREAEDEMRYGDRYTSEIPEYSRVQHEEF